MSKCAKCGKEIKGFWNKLKHISNHRYYTNFKDNNKGKENAMNER